MGQMQYCYYVRHIHVVHSLPLTKGYRINFLPLTEPNVTDSLG